MYLTTMELYRRLEACRRRRDSRCSSATWRYGWRPGRAASSLSLTTPEEGGGGAGREGQRVVGSGRTGAQSGRTQLEETACELTLVVTLRHTLRHLARVIHQACLVIFSDPGTLPLPYPLGERTS